jgi:hypothetical protein
MANSEMLLGLASLWILGFMMPIGLHRRTVLLLALTGVSLLLGLDLGLEAAGRALD